MLSGYLDVWVIHSLFVSLVSRWTWKVNWELTRCLCIWLHNLHMVVRKKSKDFLSGTGNNNGSPWQANFWCHLATVESSYWKKVLGCWGPGGGICQDTTSQESLFSEFRKAVECSFHNIRHWDWEKRSGTVQNCANTKSANNKKNTGIEAAHWQLQAFLPLE